MDVFLEKDLELNGILSSLGKTQPGLLALQQNLSIYLFIYLQDFLAAPLAVVSEHCTTILKL